MSNDLAVVDMAPELKFSPLNNTPQGYLTMKPFTRWIGYLIVLAFLALVFLPSPVQAAIVLDGNVEPNDPVLWENELSTITAYIGHTSAGSLAIDCGSTAFSRDAYLGYAFGAIGTASVSGDSTVWHNASSLHVGYNGIGGLGITGGGTVNSNGGNVGYESGAIGTVTVSGSESVWAYSQYRESTEIIVWEEDFPIIVVPAFDIIDHDTFLSPTPLAVTENDGRLYIGQGGTGRLEITDGGEAISVGGHIGYEADAIGIVNVSGIGSTWKTTTRYTLVSLEQPTVDLSVSTSKGLFDAIDPIWGYRYPDTICVGREGTGQLNITDGGMVTGHGGSIGYTSGATGTVSISGTGSTWKSLESCWLSLFGDPLYVGEKGIGQLNITDGGAVTSDGGYLGYDAGSIGTVTVSGSGSRWENYSESILVEDEIVVGLSGTGQLNITNAGTVTCASSEIGAISGSAGSVVVSGIGSMWTIYGGGRTDNSRFLVGNQGNGQLNITDGGMVSSTGSKIGSLAGSSGTVNVSGAGSTWTTGMSEHHWDSDKLYVGYGGTGILNVTDGGTVLGKGGLIGYQEGAVGVVTVSGDNSNWTNGMSDEAFPMEDLLFPMEGLLFPSHGYYGNLYVGYLGQGTLNITDGGTVGVFGQTWLGLGARDAGTIHFDSGTLNTGGLTTEVSQLTGTGTINTHGLVSDVDLRFDTPGSSSLTIPVNHEPGQNVTIHLAQSDAGDLGVGYRGNAALTIENGATVESYNGYLGYHEGSLGTATVSGNGSAWKNSFVLFIGGQKGNGQLDISNGGTVESSCVLLGYSATSTGKITVSGNQSTLKSMELDIGIHGSGQLDILDGATVDSSSVQLGANDGASGTVSVSGHGSLLKGYGLAIGDSGTGTLNLLDAGAAQVAGQTWVGHDGGTGTIHFDNGTLTTNGLNFAIPSLTGTGTVQTQGLVSDIDLRFDATNGLSKTIILDDLDEQDITIHLTQGAAGDLGVGHTNHAALVIQDGLTVECNSGYLGLNSGSSGTANVSGVNTQWVCHGALDVGDKGAGSLTVSDGAVISSFRGTVGCEYNSAGTVTVSGHGSQWNCDYFIVVGSYGDGQLNLIDGGTAFSYVGEIGSNANATGKVTVSGTGSGWTTDRLSIGHDGTGELIIANGGTVTNRTAYLGEYSGSIGTVTVTGNGSTWTNTEDLRFGSVHDGISTLSITDGGLVSVAGSLDVRYNSFINLSTGGMLALFGETDESLDEFFELVNCTDVIRWWDDEIDDWAPITTATEGVDYTIEYRTEGDLAGYTILTVGCVPEPGTVMLIVTALLAAGVVPALKKRRCYSPSYKIILSILFIHVNF